MEKTIFNKRIFSILDTDGSGDLNFGEFLVGLWSFCSVENKNFEHFAFDLYDTDNSGIIDVSEAQFMLKDIYGEEFDRSPRARKVHQKLDDLGMAVMDFPVFRDFTHKHKAMLYPAFALQLTLKKYIMGKAFWKRQAQNREKLCRGEYKTIQAILGEELFEKQKGGHTKNKRRNSGPRRSRTLSFEAPAGPEASSKRRASWDSQTDQSSAPGRRNSGRRGSRTLSFEAPAHPESLSKRRASWDSQTDLSSAPGSRRGSAELDVDLGLLRGPRNEISTSSCRSRRGSRDYDSSHEVAPSSHRNLKDNTLRRSGSKVSEKKNSNSIPITDSRSLEIYQSLLAGAEQNEAPPPRQLHKDRKPVKLRSEMKRWGRRCSSVHPAAVTVQTGGNVRRTHTMGEQVEDGHANERNHLLRRNTIF